MEGIFGGGGGVRFGTAPPGSLGLSYPHGPGAVSPFNFQNGNAGGAPIVTTVTDTDSSAENSGGRVEVISQGVHVNLEKQMYESGSSSGDVIYENLGAEQLVFNRTHDHKDSKSLGLHQYLVKTLSALNRHLYQDNSDTKAYARLLDACEPGGVMDHWKFMGIQRTNVNETSYPMQTEVVIAVHQLMNAKTPNIWLPDTSVRPADGSAPEFIHCGHRVWLLCKCVRRQGAAGFAGADDSDDDGSGGKRRRNYESSGYIFAGNPPEVYHTPELADGSEAEAERYWTFEPWSTPGDLSPDPDLYNKGECYGAAIKLGTVVDLYRSQDVMPDTYKWARSAVHGLLDPAQSNNVLDKLPQVMLTLTPKIV